MKISLCYINSKLIMSNRTDCIYNSSNGVSAFVHTIIMERQIQYSDYYCLTASMSQIYIQCTSRQIQLY
jgi:hypothetical protein